MPTVHLNGIDLYYEEQGAGPAVLLTHGYASTSSMWQPQRDALSQHHRLITWDMRGHGQTDSPDDPASYSEAHTVEDIAALLRHLAVDRAVIGGLSLGGYMSMAFYLAHPAMTRALLLCDTGPGYRNPTAREGWNERAFARAERFESHGFDALGSSPEVARVREQHRSAQGLVLAARGMLAQFDARVIESLNQIRVPTLLVVGANDTPFLAGMDYMEAKIPGARKVVIPDAGHSSNIDQPAVFNTVVQDFLANLP